MEPKISELETQRLALITEASALSEKPGATAEELAQADTKIDQAEKLGEQVKIQKSQEHRKRRIETAKLAVQAGSPATLSVVSLPSGIGNDGASLADNLPAIPKSYGQLKAFKGEGADRLAYAFGAFCLGLTNLPCASYYRKRAEDLGFSYLAMGTGADSAGGYLVQPMVGQVINYLRLQYGVARRNCEMVPMGHSEIVNHPSITAGLRVYPATEGVARSTSDLTYANVELISRDWAILSIFSNKISELAVIQLGDTIANDMGYQFALNEDTCAFNGDGTSTYQGIQGVAWKLSQTGYSASVYTSATGHTSFGTLTSADFAGVQATLPNFAGIQPKWYIHHAGWAASMQILVMTATGVISLEQAATKYFLGYPVEFVEVLPKTLAAQVGVIVALFGDLRLAAKFGDRQQVRMATSVDRYFELDQTAVKGEASFAFNHYRTGDTTNAGPIVALKMAAS